jgi:hypothetical protein
MARPRVVANPVSKPDSRDGSTQPLCVVVKACASHDGMGLPRGPAVVGIRASRGTRYDGGARHAPAVSRGRGDWSITWVHGRRVDPRMVRCRCEKCPANRPLLSCNSVAGRVSLGAATACSAFVSRSRAGAGSKGVPMTSKINARAYSVPRHERFSRSVESGPGHVPGSDGRDLHPSPSRRGRACLPLGATIETMPELEGCVVGLSDDRRSLHVTC